MLFPALTAAREASRNSACKNNLRQLGVGLQDNAALDRKYCTGAFDWFGEGCVTETGWVADLVNKGVTVGKMRCPSSPAKTSEAYRDLLSGNAIGAATCSEIDMSGSSSYTLPDGLTVVMNPCREIIETPLAPDSEERRVVVQEKIYNEFYNTNYTASWFLVRMGLTLESNGSLKTPPCGDTLPANRFCTEGPLEQTKVDLLMHRRAPFRCSVAGALSQTPCRWKWGMPNKDHRWRNRTRTVRCGWAICQSRPLLLGRRRVGPRAGGPSGMIPARTTGDLSLSIGATAISCSPMAVSDPSKMRITMAI